MKKCYTFILSTSLFLLFSPFAMAQYTSIPDLEFEQFLITQAIDSEGILDGQVLTSDVATVTTLDLSNTSISDITGIQNFTSLITLKALGQSNLIDIDVSGLTTLENINFWLCTNVTTLNVTGCSNLKNLNIAFTRIGTLDLTTNLLLETLDFERNMALLDLDVSGKTNLTFLYGRESSIQNLNVTGCSALTIININETSVQSLDLSGNTAVTDLGFYRTGLRMLNVADCTNLTSLNFTWNNYVNSINLSNCTSITDLSFRDNSTISGLVTDYLIHLESLTFHNSGVPSLDLRNNANLTTLSFSDSNIANLDLRNGNNTNLNLFINYTSLNCISVDDVDYATNNWPDVLDDVIYSADCSTLSTNNFQRQSLKLYPNPSSEFLQISGLKQHVPYSIFNMYGKILDSGILQPYKKMSIHKLDTGLYFLRINHTTTFKFIKN